MKSRTSSIIFLFFTVFCFLLQIQAMPILDLKLGKGKYTVEQMTEGHGTIWALDFLDQNRLIFTELSGAIGILNLSTKKVTVLNHNIPSQSHGQGGLLDVAVPPNFALTQRVYFTYAKKIQQNSTTVLAHAKLSGDKLLDLKELFQASPALSSGRHFGSRIAFDKNGHLFFSVGDRAERKYSQKLNNHIGKIIRLKLDGSTPTDNPFVGREGAKAEIWSYGHRNPQGLFFDLELKRLYSNEHGPRGGDEINLIKKGANYGWPVISYGQEYAGGPVGEGLTHKEGMEQPLKYFVPSIAPNSLLVYRSTKLPDFTNQFISGALALKHINLVKIKTPNDPSCESRVAIKMNERIRDVISGPNGLIYFSSDPGKIYRIIPRTPVGRSN